jgi:glutamate/tyrosine decarboxylase-like PLP-dependent enzyme
MWMRRRLHVDAAFAGVYALLPELRHHFDGVAACDSFSTNAHKVCAQDTGKCA